MMRSLRLLMMGMAIDAFAVIGVDGFPVLCLIGTDVFLVDILASFAFCNRVAMVIVILGVADCKINRGPLPHARLMVWREDEFERAFEIELFIGFNVVDGARFL